MRPGTPIAIAGGCGAVAGWAVVLAWAPTFASALLALNLAVAGATLLGQVWWARRSDALPLVPLDPVPTGSGGEQLPFVSVHIATCNESPRQVVATLDALARSAYPRDRFEVVVLDNNTEDEQLWRPVEQHCQALGAGFRFVHIRHLAGAKAGALNRCLALTAPRADLVAVVDADYRVAPGMLSAAALRLRDPDLSHVQFPQAYFNCLGDTDPLADEFRHYFGLFMTNASRAGLPLLTGTLSVLRRRALDEVGGWSSETITEDAELGVRLGRAGYRGHYIHRCGGLGEMPGDFLELRKQRFRWVAGNAQTLLRALVRGDLFRLGSFRRSAAAWLQLTAWFNWLALPALTLVAVAALVAAGLPSAATASGLAGATVLLWLAAKAAVFRQLFPAGSGGCGGGRARWLRALAVHGALAWESGFGAVAGALSRHLPFRRTQKGSTSSSGRGWLSPLRVHVGGLVLAASAASVYAARAAWLELSALLVIAGLFSLAPWLDAGIRRRAARPPRGRLRAAAPPARASARPLTAHLPTLQQPCFKTSPSPPTTAPTASPKRSGHPSTRARMA